jgi:hypothetical protein
MLSEWLRVTQLGNNSQDLNPESLASKCHGKMMIDFNFPSGEEVELRGSSVLRQTL